MASVLVGFRYFVLGFFIVCNTVLCSVGVWNLALVQNKPFYNAQISAYMIFLGAFGLLFIFPIIFIDLIRRHAFTSRIWVEFTWVTVFWIMELAGAAALSVIVPSNHCQRYPGKAWANTCLSGQILLAFAWVITLILLGYMVTLAIHAAVHQATDPNVNIWNETVREYPWFAARSKLSSAPPSPTTEKVFRVPTLKHPRPQAAFNPSGLARERSPFDDPVQPIPTFDSIPQQSYQPTQRPYEGLHLATMRDPPPIVDPTFTRPREAPQPPIRAQSLYPGHMQAQLPIEARNNLYRQSNQLEGQEPSPLGDWPRNARTNGSANGHSRRQTPISTEASALTRQPLPPIPSDPRQRLGLSGTTYVSSPPSYGLGSPVRGPRRSNDVRKQPPPPLNLDGISNKSYQARR